MCKPRTYKQQFTVYSPGLKFISHFCHKDQEISFCVSDDTDCFSGADPLAMYRWSILRSFFSAVHAFKMAGRHYRASKRQRVFRIQTSLFLGSQARRHQWPLQIINWNLKARDIINKYLMNFFFSVCPVSYGLRSRSVRGNYIPGFRSPNLLTLQTSLYQAHSY